MDELTERLRRFVRSRVASRQDAEDVIQDAYLRVLRYSADHEVESRERLLFSAARNLAVDSRRRRSVRERNLGECAILAPENCPATDEVVEARERLRRVEAAISLLPARCKQVFLLHRIDGMSYSQIARFIGVTVSAVEKHIARACLSIEAYVNSEHNDR